MAIRNFWVEADIDGRETTLAGWPRSKYGGLTLHLYQRDNGEISGVVTIVCRESGGKLYTEISADGTEVKIVTDR